ncbi:TonB-dependent siderophore receptor [Celeribacter indicus]|uniref:Ferrichrome receptor protein n=1 Tax=Celeribacter indicus TaxID=1208324 RepID=A0A0B5E0E1_9RHOB|nr:TonB-dependent siderophore receptor [Celeribacter indicus]AJE48704.1 ferrichrome receptor precursor protein [Celeribacter indicus]SDX12511.1 iron complex outermembrane recepter protein [Celeribacter indicus]
MISSDRGLSPRVAAKRHLLCHTALIGLLASGLPAQAQDEAGVVELMPIVVQNKLAYSGAIDGYLAPATETGVKSGVPLAEVPQSITVVTSTELEARAPRQVEDSIAYVAGVLPSTWGTDDRYDQFSIRGFDMGPYALYRDGLPQKALSFSGFTVDPYMIERVDVLRGPAGVLYGSNDAGGMVNLVTKRPVFDSLGETRLSYDSNGTGSVGFDWSDVLSPDGAVAGRITGLVRDGETEVDRSENDRSFLSASLTWAPTDDTALTILGHVQRDSLTPLTITPVNGEDIDPSWGRVPGDYAYRQSDYNFFETEQETIGWELTHSFTPELTLNQRLRYADQSTDYAQLDFGSAQADGLHYYAFHNEERARTLGIDTNLSWTRGFGAAENTLTAGVDYQHSRYRVAQKLDYSEYIVPYDDPEFDFPVSDPIDGSTTRTTYVEKGLYLQDHIDFGQGTTVTAGLRHSWFETKAEDLDNDTEDSQDNSATTGMIGLTHDFANGLTPYASYTEGFIQNVGTTLEGDVLDPSESTQWELGLRYAPTADLILSAALFDLRKTNVKEYDTRDTTWSSFLQAGEVRSRGLELEARGRLSARLQGTASYTYLDTEITKSVMRDDPDAGTVDIRGNENNFAPNHQLSLWLDYDASALLPGLSLGGGLRSVSSYYATQENGRRTSGYTLADLAVSYEVSDFSIDLGVTNLFDEDYYSMCYDDYGCTRGEGRIVTLSLQRSF